MSERFSRRARWIVLLAAIAMVGPVLAGCISARDTARAIKTACTDDAGGAVITPTPPTPLGSTEPPKTGEKVQGGTPVKLGLLLPPARSSIVEDARRGAELAAVQIETAGVTTRLAVEQTDGTIEGASRAFNRLVAHEKVSAIVSALDAPTTEALLSLAKTHRVPILAATADEGYLSAGGANDVYFWRIPPTDALEGKALVQLLIESGCRTAIVVAEDTSHANAVAQAFLSAVHKRGGSARDLVRFPAGNPDTADIVSRLAQSDAQSIVLIAQPKDAAKIVKAAYAHEPKGRMQRDGHNHAILSRQVLFLSGALRDPAFVNDVGDRAQGGPILAGLRGTAPTRAHTPALPVFEQSYYLRYSASPALAAAETYDATWIGALAIQCAQSERPERVALKIREVVNADAGDATASGEDPGAALTVARNCNVNYVGAVHDYDVDAYGDPATGPFAFWVVGDDGSIRTLRTLYEP